jgi:hypothetical protein
VIFAPNQAIVISGNGRTAAFIGSGLLWLETAFSFFAPAKRLRRRPTRGLALAGLKNEFSTTNQTQGCIGCLKFKRNHEKKEYIRFQYRTCARLMEC